MLVTKYCFEPSSARQRAKLLSSSRPTGTGVAPDGTGIDS